MGELCLPERMFAAGEEPNGERVNTYHKPKRIESIIEALDPDEVDFLRSTTFGKIISQAENPSFSGSFGQFVIVHMLRVKKKYEIWFLFAGRPIRMSLHEFAHVTGLNCKKIPIKNTKKRKKNPINEKLYWGELFGSLKFCLVNLAIEMLKKRDQGPEMDEFLAYPWGRVSFEMLVTGIKKKDEILLSQASVALPGFVDAIQLVFMVAVPQIKEIVPQNETVVDIESDSDSESGCNEPQAEEGEEKDATESTTPQSPVRYCVNPAHVKALDEEAKVEPISMFEDTTHSPQDLVWDDEAEDDTVDNMRKNKENMWVDQITTMQAFPRSELSFMSDVGIILTGGENDLLNATPAENDVSLIHYIFM
uniref:DUF1985 domain-containing protein n=1 Tax=Brassica oleracea var. oleracea TaxID=109376 RepID=A0A0D3EGZ6_BRAOL